MKARVKATGDTVDVFKAIKYIDIDGDMYEEDDLEFDMKNHGDGVVYIDPTIDYWTRLEHLYAGMAMQGKLAHGENYGNSREHICNKIVDYAVDVAHALVQRLKEESK